MSLAVTESQTDVTEPASRPVVNNVVIKIATANGTGSQSANLILMRSIFNMGIPVSGKNLFPSNIQGLPTWFTIRASEQGYLARRRQTDIVICMNPETVEEDIQECSPGTILILNEDLRGYLKRDDLQVYICPFSTLVKEICPQARLRRMVINILYVGVLAYLLEIDMDAMLSAIDKQFASKPKPAELNKDSAKAAYEWAKKTLDQQNRFRLRPSKAALGKIIIEGNQACGMGMMFGGATVACWYPITPSSSLCENFIDYCARFRHREDGKATYAVFQAEDELAAMAMVVGAGWAGARTFTSTSGPGISLMAELAGLAYFAEIPGVIVDVQRVGPSTGLPTRTSQGDIMKAYYLSHGDCKHVLLIPGNVEECFDFSAEALNLAEELQTLIFVMTDLDMGMNNWMSDPFSKPHKEIRRGKVLTAADLDRLGGFGRYRDVDGDGIPYRTLPGTQHPKAAYFTRGTGHTPDAGYSEKPHDWKNNLDRLTRKFETARKMVPAPIVDPMPGAEVGILAYGSSDLAMEEARQMLQRQGIKTDYMRLRALPFAPSVSEFVKNHPVTYVVEQNRDAQVASIFRSEYPHLATKIASVLHYNGLPLDALSIVEQVIQGESSHKENGRS